jgi:hypothetical protein
MTEDPNHDYTDGNHSTLSDGRPHNVNNVKEAQRELAEAVAMFHRPDIESIVCEDIKRRQHLGLAKYGTTVANNPLTLREWLLHQYSELLDAAIYARRAIDEIDRNAAND